MPELREDKTGRDSHIEVLVKHAKSGNRYSFEKLIVIFQEDIFRMAYYRTGSHMDAEDLTQDIFTQAFRGISRLKEVSHFKSWLYRIAVNRVHDFYKKKRVLVFLGSRDDLADFYRNGTSLPVIFDDILVNFDPQRQQKACEAIGLLTETNQVFYFTCHPETANMLEKAVDGAKVVEIG